MHPRSCVGLLVCTVFGICRHSGFSTQPASCPLHVLNWKSYLSKLWSVRTTNSFPHMYMSECRNASQNVHLLTLVTYYLRSNFVKVRLPYATTLSVPSMICDKTSSIDTLLASVPKINGRVKSYTHWLA